MTHYIIDPLVNIRCLEGLVLALGDQLIEFEGSESVLITVFSKPRTVDEAIAYLTSLGMSCDKATMEQDVAMLHEYGVLREYNEDEIPKFMQAGGSDFYLSEVLRNIVGHTASMIDNKWVDSKGEPLPPTTYGIGFWLKRYDISDKHVLLTSSDTSLDWWSKNCAKVTLIKDDGVSAMAVASLGNVNVVDSVNPSSDSFDIIEVRGDGFDKSWAGTGIIKSTGAILLPFPELQTSLVDALSTTSLIEVPTSGIIPGISGFVGYSLYLGREFDWKKRPLKGVLNDVDIDIDTSTPLTGQYPRPSLAPSARSGGPTPSLRPSFRPGKK